MQVQVENEGKLGRKFTVSFPAERFHVGVSERIAKISRTVRLKGFRQGKVPGTLIQQRFGQQVRSEVLSDLIDSTLREALAQEKLQPTAQPSIDTTGQIENGQINYTATFEVIPEFPELDVSALEIQRPEAIVTESDVDAMIETLRQQRRQFLSVSRAATQGDFVMYDYSACIARQRFPTAGMERTSHLIGSDLRFKALDEALTGHVAGDTFEAEVTFPGDFHKAPLAGKTAHLEGQLVKLMESELPAIDSHFVRQFGVADGDLETFRTEVRASLERELKANLLTRLRLEVASKLASAYDGVEVPATMVQAEAQKLAASGFEKDQTPSSNRIDAVRPLARKRVLAGLLLAEVARRHDIRLDQVRLAEQLTVTASTHREPKKILELYKKNAHLMDGLRHRVLEDQVAQWVADRAKTTIKHLSFSEVMQPGDTGRVFTENPWAQIR